MAFHSRAQLFAALKALGGWLEEQAPASIGDRLELFVCGGASFLFHELPRYLDVTNDVDVWCRFEHDEVVSMSHWPEFLEKGIAIVRSKFSPPLPQNWLNCEASQISRHFGLPNGARQRATAMDFGSYLQIWFCSRHELVAFKFLALIAAKHRVTKNKSHNDLLALNPTCEEIRDARDWLLNAHGATQTWKDDCETEFQQWQFS